MPSIDPWVYSSYQDNDVSNPGCAHSQWKTRTISQVLWSSFEAIEADRKGLKEYLFLSECQFLNVDRMRLEDEWRRETRSKPGSRTTREPIADQWRDEASEMDSKESELLF